MRSSDWGSDVCSSDLSRCTPCHAAKPTFDGIAEAPKGIMLETPEQLKRYAALINQQAVRTETMPPGNATGVTEEERQKIGAWIAAGAPLDRSEERRGGKEGARPGRYRGGPAN